MTKRRIVVVEDDPTLRKMLTKQLERMGHEVLAFEHGEAILSWIEEHGATIPIDLVCLDLALPAMSGYRVCEHIRQTPCTRDVPVFVISARTTVQDHTFALEVGADAFLEKPFKLKEFESEVLRLLQMGEP